MKKISILLIVFVLGTCLANATPISPIAAQKIAANFYKQYATQIAKATSLIYTEKSIDGNALFYVFNVNENDGFIVVAADDKVNSIINYSTQGQFNVPIPKTTVVRIETWNGKNWAIPSSKV